MRAAFSYLAARRLASVSLALAAEVGILVGLAQASPSDVVGVPAAVGAAIAGTVAVVFKPLDGVVIAFVGAFVFGLLGDWRTGEVAALVIWPGIVLAVGLFASNVERRRRALGRIVDAQEDERHRLALELHDETAQTLVAALITLRRAELASDPAVSAGAVATSRGLIEDTVQAVRELAVDLRPRVLDDYGLLPAVERLAAALSGRTGMRVDVTQRGWVDRPPPEVELALYRIVQDALANAAGRHATVVEITLERDAGKAAVVVQAEGSDRSGGQGADFDWLRERVRLLDGRFVVNATAAGATLLRAEIPIARGYPSTRGRFRVRTRREDAPRHP